MRLSCIDSRAKYSFLDIICEHLPAYVSSPHSDPSQKRSEPCGGDRQISSPEFAELANDRISISRFIAELLCGRIGPMSFKPLASSKSHSFYIRIVHHRLRVTLLMGKGSSQTLTRDVTVLRSRRPLFQRRSNLRALCHGPTQFQTSSSGEKFPLSYICLDETAAVGQVLFWVVTTPTRFASRGVNISPANVWRRRCWP